MKISGSFQSAIISTTILLLGGGPARKAGLFSTGLYTGVEAPVDTMRSCDALVPEIQPTSCTACSNTPRLLAVPETTSALVLMKT